MGKLTKVFLALCLLICIAFGVYLSLGGKKNFEVIVVEFDERKIVKVIDRHPFLVPYDDADQSISERV